MIECKKCGTKYNTEQPFCTNVEGGCLDYTIQKIEYPKSGGTFTHIHGMKYAYNGYPDHLTLGQNATVKRALISTIKLAFKIWRHPIQAPINWLAEVYEAEYEKFQIQEHRLSRSSKEILRVGRLFAKNDRQLKAAWCIAMFWEMDTAYRYRGQDILAELDQEAAKKNIGKEVMRLLKLGIGRELIIRDKWKLFLWLAKIAMWIPAIRRTVKAMLLELKLPEIKPDISDKYFMARYFDYNFAGLPYEIRAAWKAQEDEDYVDPVIKVEEYANVHVNPNKFFYQLSPVMAEKMAEIVKSRILELHKKRNEQGRMGDTDHKDHIGANSPVSAV